MCMGGLVMVSIVSYNCHSLKRVCEIFANLRIVFVLSSSAESGM